MLPDTQIITPTKRTFSDSQPHFGLNFVVLTLLTPLSLASNADDSVTLPDMKVHPGQSYLSAPAVSGQNWKMERAELAAMTRTDLNDLVSLTPGVTYNSTGGSGSTSNLTYRGAQSGSGLMTWDGVPLFSSVIGQFGAARFPLDFMQEVRFNTSFASPAQSSRSLGGTMAVDSRKLEDGQGFWHAEGGSYGTLRNNLGIGLNTAWGNWTLVGGRTDIFDGANQSIPERGHERDPYSATMGLLRWDQAFSHGAMDASLYYVNNPSQMDGPGVLQLQPQPIVGWTDDPDGYMNNETWVAQLHGQVNLTPNWMSEFRVGYTQNRESGSLGQVPTPQGIRRFSMNMTSQLWLLNWQNTHGWNLEDENHQIRWIWGVDMQQQHGSSPDQRAGITALTHSIISPIARLEWDWGNGFGSAQVQTDLLDRYANRVLFKLLAGRFLTPNTKIWASGGTGYRQPAVNELLHPLLGSPNLQPEKSAGGEIGMEWQPLDVLQFKLTGFYQHYRNMIVASQATPTSLFQPTNISKAHTIGVEWQGEYQWHPDWKSGISYTFMDTENLDNGLKVSSRPEHQGRFWTQWQITTPLSLRVDVRYRDRQYADITNQKALPSQTQLQAHLNYQLNDTTRIYVRGENINDDRSSSINGFYTAGPAVYGGFFLDW